MPEPIPLLSAGSSIGAAQINSVAQSLDDALSALFGGFSPMVYLPVTGSTSWYESKLSGQLFIFGTGEKRLLTGHAIPNVQGFSMVPHNQAVYDAMASTSQMRGGPNRIDHTLKQVTVDEYTLAGSPYPFVEKSFDRSLKIHRKTFTDADGTHENYFLRIFALSADGREYFYNERKRELEVIDLAFEGHSARTFTFLSAWDKFDCIRVHNLDADEEPLVVTFQGTPDLQVTVPRWRCVSVRRNGTGWEQQGFLLFRARESDVSRFGRTMPWNERPNSAPWWQMRESDVANNVASFASVVFWLDYFSHGSQPAEILSPGGGGVLGANDTRTGIWFDKSKLVPQASVSGLPSPTDPATEIWKLTRHGGQFLLVRRPPDPEEPDPPAVPEVTVYTATLDELLAPGHPSGIKLDVVDGDELKIKYTAGGTYDWVDFVPIGPNFSGPTSLPVDGTPVTLGESYLPSVYLERIVTTTAVSENVRGYSGYTLREYPGLGLEGTTGGGVVPAFGVTVEDLEGWEFPGGGKDNAHCTFADEGESAWDGRKFAIQTSLEFSPALPVMFPSTLLDTLMSKGVVVNSDSMTWGQGYIVQTFPSRGGTWFLPSHPRRAWAPVLDNLYHPHVVGAYGMPDGGDWTALPTTQAPKSSVARLENLPGGTNYSWSCAGYPATDSLTFLSASTPSPEFYEANRSAILAGSILPGETRPILGAALQATHYNVIASRLNAISQVIPFTFLDAQWYGKPFRPPVGRAGIYGGHVYPAGHLCNAQAGSTAATRAATLGIPVLSLATTHPVFAEMAEYGPIRATTGSSVYTAFDEANLLNDLLSWFNPAVVYSDFTVIGQTGGGGWTQGYGAQPTVYGYYWWKNDTLHAAAVVPTFQYILAEDVYATATELGFPFRVERIGMPLKIKVFLPVRNGYGVRAYPPPPSFIGTRTQAMLVVDRDPEPQLVAYAGRTGNPADNFWFAPDGTVRLMNWPRYPGPLGTDDPECAEMICSGGKGYGRAGYGAGPVGGALNWLFSSTISYGSGSPFTGEAPLLKVERYFSAPDLPEGWSYAESRLLTLPVSAVQWDSEQTTGTRLRNSDPPPISEGGIFRTISSVPSSLSASVLAGEGWDGFGGFQVAILPGSARPVEEEPEEEPEE